MAFEEHCTNYRFTAEGRDVLARLGITGDDLTTELYAHAVMRSRGGQD